MTDTELEPWRHAFRNGFAPVLPTAGLEALRDALTRDDHALCQGQTVFPSPVNAPDWPPEAACAVGYCGWKGCDLPTVEQVGEFFAETCFAADRLLGEPAACRHLLNWVDDMPREVVRAELLPEVEAVLAVRRGEVA